MSSEIVGPHSICIQNEAQQGPAFSPDATARKWAIAKPRYEQAAQGCSEATTNSTYIFAVILG